MGDKRNLQMPASAKDCFELMDQANYTDAIKCLLKVYNKLKNPVFQGIILRYVAHCQYKLDKLKDAKKSCKSAISLLEPEAPREKLPYRERRLAQSHLLQCYKLLGVISRAEGKRDKALAYYRKVVSFCEETGTHMGVLADTYYVLGNIYKLDFHDNEKALEFYNKSIENNWKAGISTDADISSSFPSSYHNAGIIYHKRGNWQKCLEFSLLDLFYGAYMNMTKKVEDAKGLIIEYYQNLNNLGEHEKIAKAFCYAIDDLLTTISDRKRAYELIKLATSVLRANPSVDGNPYMKLAKNIIHGNRDRAKRLLIRNEKIREDESFRESGEISELINELQQEEKEKPTIGIVTALDKEYTAMETLIENSRPPFRIPGRGAGRRYLFGEVPTANDEKHYVVLALADKGNNKAASRATLLLEHFPNVRSIIMVGIAGGMPNPDKPNEHVRLGDVVVSDEKGVIQYDFVKETSRWIIPNYAPKPPSAELLEAVRLLEAAKMKRERPWLKFIENVLQQLRVTRPAEETDILVSSTDPEKVIPHPEDPDRVEGKPRIFLGPIASANTLLKDPVKRDMLRDTYGAKAAEMEGSGIADASWYHDAGYLVVRGICDYCDSKKGILWQKYAAVAAAAYTRALLESMPI